MDLVICALFSDNLNRNFEQPAHDEARCEYVRCHEDVYDNSKWP